MEKLLLALLGGRQGSAKLLLLALLGAARQGSAEAAAFTAGNLVTLRMTQSAVWSGTTAAAYLDELTPAGAVVQTIPVTGVNPLSIAGNGWDQGQLTRSADRQYLVLAGYHAAAGTSSLSSTSGSNVIACRRAESLTQAPQCRMGAGSPR